MSDQNYQDQHTQPHPQTGVGTVETIQDDGDIFDQEQKENEDQKESSGQEDEHVVSQPSHGTASQQQQGEQNQNNEESEQKQQTEPQAVGVHQEEEATLGEDTYAQNGAPDQVGTQEVDAPQQDRQLQSDNQKQENGLERYYSFEKQIEGFQQPQQQGQQEQEQQEQNQHSHQSQDEDGDYTGQEQEQISHGDQVQSENEDQVNVDVPQHQYKSQQDVHSPRSEEQPWQQEVQSNRVQEQVLLSSDRKSEDNDQEKQPPSPRSQRSRGELSGRQLQMEGHPQLSGLQQHNHIQTSSFHQPEKVMPQQQQPSSQQPKQNQESVHTKTQSTQVVMSRTIQTQIRQQKNKRPQDRYMHTQPEIREVPRKATKETQPVPIPVPVAVPVAVPEAAPVLVSKKQVVELPARQSSIPIREFPPVALVQASPVEEETLQVMILPPDGFKISGAAVMYSSAFEERRQINRRFVIQFLEKRNMYFANHTGVFDHIKLGLLLRIKLARQAVESFKQFYTQQAQSYRAMVTRMKHVEDTYTKVQSQTLDVHWSPAITSGIYRNVQDQCMIIDMMKSYRDLVSRDIVEQLDQALAAYQDQLLRCENLTIDQRKKFTDFEEKVVGLQKNLHKKFKSQKASAKRDKGYDLAEEEIVILREMRVANQKLSNWGESVIAWWEQQAMQQVLLITKVKQQATRFVDLSNKVHVLSKELVQKCHSWSKVNVKDDVAINLEFENIVCLTDIDFVRGSLETYNQMKRADRLSIEDIKTFNKIEYPERITGRSDIIIEGLVTKQFRCVQASSGSLEPEKLRMLATIDDNLLIVDPKQNIVRVKFADMMNTRAEPSLVKLNHKKKGWFSDDWQTILLRFGTTDAAEEFMFFTETNLEAKKDYVI